MFFVGGAVAQLVGQSSTKSEVRGSNPSPGQEPDLTRDWTGTLQEDFSHPAHHVINFTSALYHPWGNRAGSATAAILYTTCISGSNLFLVFLLITNVKLLNSRQNVVLLHNAVSDLSAGVFYFPLTADFFIRGFWAHGCPGFFVWFTFVFPLTFLGCHSVLILLGMRLLQNVAKQNIVLLHNAVSDLSAGVFYFPLTADFFIRGFWAHGCPGFFVWFTFVFPLTFLGCHSVLILLGMRLLQNVAKGRAVVLGTGAQNVLLGVTFLLTWTYLVAIGAVLSAGRHDNVHIAIAPSVICRALVASEGAVVINILVYFLPAGLSLILILIVMILEKTTLAPPTIQLRLETDTERCASLPLSVLSLVTIFTSLLPLPAFLITTSMASGACAHVSCPNWLLPLGTISDWILFAKPGIVPVVLFLAPDFRSAAKGALHHFRSVPTSDTRDLVNNMADEEDDTPFSSM
ncbi:hypothetical protein PoB_006047000 [Plakobranchus ocellatus]|uniref:G-protein coupled receptors family 1 profile domain-containing protein n=1 Tax=Plakobranchus ocellatus TaxID=259542 RepID=A0AAV4CQ46_9GAST|nr:hypothetical protein PoB_006047000 [Plakobranchus ocellatus]